MNLGFDFDGDYKQSTSKQLFGHHGGPGACIDEDDIEDFTKTDLLKMLSFLEGELEASDIVIKHLKNERTKFLMYDAKYGKLSGNDPFGALRRDSCTTEEILDETSIGMLYESQLVQLEKMIAAQRKSHNKAKSLLAATEKRHAKALLELELEKERKSRYAAQGDDVVALLERERNKLTQQLEFQMNEVTAAKQETEKVERRLEAEKERHKAMVLYLINERKQLLLKTHELRIKAETAPQQHHPPVSSPAEQALIEELKKEIDFMRQERDILRKNNASLKADNLSLKEVVKDQESDMNLMRKNLLASTKLSLVEKQPNTLPPLTDERSLVVANRMISSTSGPPRPRIPSSSTFPAEKNNSRLPRAPSSPGRGLPSPSRNPSSPTKKIPAMGVSSRLRPAPSTSAEPELQQLEAAIESIAGPNVAPSMPTKRSSSLPRGSSTEGRRVVELLPQSASRSAPRPQPPQMGSASRIVAPTRLADSQRKLSGTIKKNGLSALSKAFGGGSGGK